MWYYKDEEYNEVHDPKLIGFVYCITNLENNKKYIGKKLFNFTRTTTKVVKLKSGEKKKKKVRKTIDSDWLSYYGSNEELNNDVITLGADKFRRDILHLCYTKGDCSYLELREQIDNRVLENDLFYNSWISARVRKSHLKLN